MSTAQKIAVNILSNNRKNGVFWSLITLGSIAVSMLTSIIAVIIKSVIDTNHELGLYAFIITNIITTSILLYSKYINDHGLDFDLSWLDTGILSLHAGLIFGMSMSIVDTSYFYYGFFTGNAMFTLFLIINMLGVFHNEKDLRPTWKTVILSLWAPYTLLLALVGSLVIATIIKDSITGFWRGLNRK